MKKELSLLFTGICCANNIFLLSNVAIAQIAIDGTTNTIVNSADNSNFTIENGDRVGGNLFHSFDAFSIPSGGSAIFNNVPEIENIFSRVTGGNISNIDGLIGANGSANLFLINPAGIIFGENARLDIGGSFYSSSASSILFEDGEFSATDLDNPPLLTINAPIGLSFRDNPGDIVNRSNFGLTNTILDSEIDPVFENPVFEGREFTLQEVTGLEIDGDRTIALIGGNVILENSAGITAPGGNVELGGLSQAGNINLNENGSLTFPEGVTRADVTLTERSKVQVAADGGGSINIHARNLELREQSELYAGIAEGMGFPDAQAGDLNINATESVRLLGNPRQTPIDFSLGLPLIDLLTIERQSATGIRNTVGISAIRRNDGSSQSSAVGNGGNIKINSQTLELSKIAVIDTGVFGSGNGGDIAINSTESVVLDQGVFLSQIQGFDEEVVKESGSGDAGNILINTNSLLLTDIALILADVQQGATGNGGDITIQVSDTFTQNQDSFILTQLGRENIGSAGDIAITAGSYEIGARTVLPALQSDSSPGSQGDAGNITIDVANDFSLTGNLIIAQIQGGATGNAGDISISANNLLIDNFALVSTNAASGTTGTAGGVSLNADNTITVSNGAVVDALTENEFDGGDITVNAQNLNLLSGGKIVTGSENLGDAGDINLNIRENLIINNQNPPDDSPFDEPILQAIELQTGLFANTFPGSTSNGGSISVKAESIDLQDRGFILAETESGSGGNINLIVEDRINLRNNSLISAEAFDRANGGNINIDTDFIIAFPNQVNGNGSDIIASAAEGNGGNITINAQSILGILERTAIADNQTNDIDASSEFGLDGNITINTPDTDALEGATELPQNVIETEQITAKACAVNRDGAAENTLTIQGKGGVQSDPATPLSADLLLGGEQLSTEHQQPKVISISTARGEIIPARGVVVKPNGDLVLTPYATDNKSVPNSNFTNCSS